MSTKVDYGLKSCIMIGLHNTQLIKSRAIRKKEGKWGIFCVTHTTGDYIGPPILCHTEAKV